MRLLSEKIGWTLSLIIVLTVLFSSRKFDDPYSRSIEGDGKGYYAYLPAIFIYQDSDFSFIDQIEKKYYPSDGSHFKDFKNLQKNGKYVNKTFPGLSLLYAPFFFLAYLLSWIAGYPLDGYSTIFQWGIALSHVFYFFLGLRILKAIFDRLKISTLVSYLCLFGILFGTNCWYYIVYDHSVSHIHNFFLASVFIFFLIKWLQEKKTKFLGVAGVVLSLMIITRPTNAMMVLFVPLLFQLCETKLDLNFVRQNLKLKILAPYFFLAIGVMIIPFLLWKWQSGLWLVYSYNDEKFYFQNPHFIDFLFSYQKGWLLWNPLILVMLLFAMYYFLKKSFKQFLFFILPLMLVVYVLSSWWCWTYGSGYGQRPMIDFLPFIMLATVLSLNQFKKKSLFVLLFLPFCILNLIQSFQITNSIINGGTTTKREYWDHFLQMKTDPPMVEINRGWQILSSKKMNEDQNVEVVHPYSKSIDFDTLKGNRFLISLEIGGKHKDDRICLVASNKDASFYRMWYLGMHVYNEPRKMQFLLDSISPQTKELKFYIWNGDSDAKATVRSMSVAEYRN